jgi:hypothetical protein
MTCFRSDGRAAETGQVLAQVHGSNPAACCTAFFAAFRCSFPAGPHTCAPSSMIVSRDGEVGAVPMWQVSLVHKLSREGATTLG